MGGRGVGVWNSNRPPPLGVSALVGGCFVWLCFGVVWCGVVCVGGLVRCAGSCGAVLDVVSSLRVCVVLCLLVFSFVLVLLCVLCVVVLWCCAVWCLLCGRVGALLCVPLSCAALCVHCDWCFCVVCCGGRILVSLHARVEHHKPQRSTTITRPNATQPLANNTT